MGLVILAVGIDVLPVAATLVHHLLLVAGRLRRIRRRVPRQPRVPRLLNIPVFGQRSKGERGKRSGRGRPAPRPGPCYGRPGGC